MSKEVQIGEGPERVAQEIAGFRRQLDYIERQMDADLGISPDVDLLAENLREGRAALAENLRRLRADNYYSKAQESNKTPEPQHPALREVASSSAPLPEQPTEIYLSDEALEFVALARNSGMVVLSSERMAVEVLSAILDIPVAVPNYEEGPNAN